jgi:hypothetical protein
MKNLLSSLALISALIVGATSCSKEFDTPPIPTAERHEFNGQVTHTIAELKSQFAGDLDSISYYVAIKGVVTGTDESGNIYKKIVIQDASGAIELSIDQNSLYTKYPVGQEIIVECQGLFIGKYGGLQQLGYKYKNTSSGAYQIGRMPVELADKHIYKNGIPTNNVTPEVVEIANLNASMMDKLVTFKNVRFTNADGTTTFSTKGSSYPVSQEFKDSKGNKVIAYTSSYANFALDVLPKGNGTISGILSYYNGTWQLLIRDKKDIGAFDGTDPGTGPAVTVTSLNETFDAGTDYGSAAINGWSVFKTVGDRDWQIKLFATDNNKYAQASAHNGTATDYEYWLVTPGLDLDKATKKMISFQTAKSFWKSTSSLEVYIMNGSNPATATKEKLNAKIAVETDTDNAWIPSGSIDLTGKSGVVYIGFRYVAKGGASNSTTFRVDNFRFGSEVQ